MKATELRIGNLIRFKKAQKTHIVTPAFFVVPEDAQNVFEPIPITEEWLEELGFDKFHESNKHKHFKNHTYLSISTHFIMYPKEQVGYFRIGQDFEVLIKYIHELQNLHLALTGQELKLKQEV